MSIFPKKLFIHAPKIQSRFNTSENPNENDSKEKKSIENQDNSLKSSFFSYTKKNTKIIPEEFKQTPFILFNITLESFLLKLLINIFTIFALFADDFRVISLPKNADSFFDALIIFCIFLFIFEIVLSTIVKANYKFSFFFWLDLISTLTLIFDLQIVQNSIFTSK